MAQGHPIAAAFGAMIAFDGVTRIEPGEELRIILPSIGGAPKTSMGLT